MATLDLILSSLQLPVVGGLFATIDEEDYPKVRGFKWRIQETKKTRYVGSTGGIQLHRLICGFPKGEHVRFIDGNFLNCTKANVILKSALRLLGYATPSRIFIRDGFAEVELSNGKLSQIDICDLTLVSGHAWHAAGKYANRHDGVPMHKAILNLDLLIDHKDRNGLNNRRGNLRVATPSQNCMNTRKIRNGDGCTSKFKGVYFDRQFKTQPWKVTITKDGKQIFVGRFQKEEDAAAAYDLKAAELFGEFAKPNFQVSQ